MKSQVEIKKYAELKYGMTNMHMDSGVTDIELKNAKIGFVSGYMQCQKDNSDKKYTEDDILKVIEMSRLCRKNKDGLEPLSNDEIIKSLNK